MRPQHYRGYAIWRRSVVDIYLTTEILAYEYENTNRRSSWTSGVDLSRYLLIHLLGRQAKVSIFKLRIAPYAGVEQTPLKRPWQNTMVCICAGSA